MVKKVIIIFILAAVILSGGFYFIKGTPRYSLYQIRKAVRDHDSISFNKYVDVDRVVSSLFDTASKNIDDEINKDSMEGFGMQIAQAMLPALKEELKNEINKNIEEISNEGSNGIADSSIKNIVREGKSANVVILNTKNEELRMAMVQTPERYWRIVSIDFDDYKKINPDQEKSGANDEDKNQVIIEKNIGDEIELATIKFKVNKAEEVNSVSGNFADPKAASDGAKFVVLDLTVTNITKEGFDFDSDGIELIDNQERKFDPWDDMIGNVKNYLEMRDMQPGISEVGTMVYEIPNDAESYAIFIGKEGTDEMYKIKLK